MIAVYSLIIPVVWRSRADDLNYSIRFIYNLQRAKKIILLFEKLSYHRPSPAQKGCNISNLGERIFSLKKWCL